MSLPARIALLLVLLAQAWVVMAQGSVVCIPVRACAHHRAACDEAPSHACAHPEDHGLAVADHHDHDDCGCHQHVPASDEHRPAPGEARDQRPVPTPMIVPSIAACAGEIAVATAASATAPRRRCPALLTMRLRL